MSLEKEHLLAVVVTFILGTLMIAWAATEIFK